MGMYTELIFGAELKKETPQGVIDTLRYMLGDIDKPKKLEFNPELSPFCVASYYFAVCNPVQKMWIDRIDSQWHISTRSNIKNYNGEIEAFLDWIKPWILGGSGNRDMYAIVIYEDEEEPTIYYLTP
jgi:hypothetical protein